MKTWLNVAEAAEYAGVSRDTIYTAVERGELRHSRLAGASRDSYKATVDR
jgi:excisionase family DNA binding protein